MTVRTLPSTLSTENCPFSWQICVHAHGRLRHLRGHSWGQDFGVMGYRIPPLRQPRPCTISRQATGWRSGNWHSTCGTVSLYDKVVQILDTKIFSRKTLAHFGGQQ